MASGSSHFAHNVVPAALLVMFLAIMPAMAATTLSNVIYRADVIPGSTVTYRMTLSTTASDAPVDYDVAVFGFGNGPNGNYATIDPGLDTGPFTARTFITLDKTAVHIEPGGKEVVTATIQVPVAGDGGRYALINLVTKPAGGGAVSFATGFNVPIMITLKGTQLTETGIIDSVSVGDAIEGQSLGVTTAFTNTGNHHYYGAKNEIAVMDNSGKEVARTATTPLITAIVPGGKVNFTQQIAAALNPGTYTVTSSMFDSKGAVLDTKTTSFTAGEPGAAVPTPTVSAAPTQAATGAPTAPMTVVRTEESPATPGAIATRAPLSVTTIMLALAAVSGILVQRRRN